MPLALTGQFLIDAGPDRIFCDNLDYTDNYDTLRLGGNPTIYNPDSVEYTISWSLLECFPDSPPPYNFRASYLLSDTAVSNPIFYNEGLEWCEFVLTVESDSGNYRDTVRVLLSHPYVTLIPFVIGLYKGDTGIIEPTMNTSHGIASISWSPDQFISDASNLNPEVWPPHNFTYKCTIVDSLGCVYQAQNSYEVQVFPPNFVDEIESLVEIAVVTTVDDIYVSNPRTFPLNIRIFTIDGKLLLQEKQNIDKFTLSRITSNPVILHISHTHSNLPLWRQIVF